MGRALTCLSVWLFYLNHEIMSDQEAEKIQSGEESDNEQVAEEEMEEDEEEPEEPVKKKKPGLIYLSTIPPKMNVQLIREALMPYGEIGRVFLQPRSKTDNKKKKGPRKYVEGWVEFLSKRNAKRVAEVLNNQKVGGKRRSASYETLWNIKYLPSFKWAHLSERLAYEKAVHQQRMRTEIAQVKRETNFFIENVDKSKRLKKKMDKLQDWVVTQRQTEDEIVSQKNAKTNPDRTEFLKELFSWIE